MNGYVHEFLTKMARESVEVTVLEANVFGKTMGEYLVNIVGEFRLPAINRALEADLEADRFIPKTQRKLS